MTQFCASLSSQNVKNPATEFFKRITRDSGIKLISTDEPNVLTQELALVVRDIEKSFCDEAEPTAIENFMRGLRVLIKKDKYLMKALMPTMMKKGNSEVDIPQESLFRIFLRVEQLQNETIEIIFENLTNSEPSVFRQLLTQLRYLPQIKNPETLCNKLIDLLEISEFPTQLEILDSIPEIIPDTVFNTLATSLIRLLETNDDLNGAIIDCLNALHLSSDIRAHIQDHILAKMLTGTCGNTFPIFLDFLMSEKNTLAVFNKIRNCLSTMINSLPAEQQIVIFQKLQKHSNKSICEQWLNVINSFKNHNDHKSVDLLLLFMLYSSTKLKKRNIEQIFKKRVKDGLFKCSLLETLFKIIPPQLLCDYFKAIIEIGATLLRNTDTNSIEFGSTLFKLVFSHAKITRNQRQEILEMFIQLIASDHQNVLHLINELTNEIAHNPNHSIILMRLLEKLDTFEINQVRVLYQILTKLTRHESLLSLNEELHMIVRKNLATNKKSLKLKGIVGAIVMVQSSETTVATSLIEMTNTSIRSHFELTSFFYDELAAMLLKQNIDLAEELIDWLFQRITADFEGNYITDHIEANADLELAIRLNLNSKEEVDDMLAVNLAPLILNGDRRIETLASHFRLVRLLHYRQSNGDLSSIDALLGCGIILPDYENFEDFGLEQREQICECLLYCINWLREVISGFVTQKSVVLRRKILERIDQLQELESLYEKNVHFQEKKIKLERKKKFRDIDTDLIKLLKYKIGECEDNEISITPQQFNFILKDYNRKLDLVLKKRHLEQSNFFVIEPQEMINDCKFVLLNLNVHFETFLNHKSDESFGLILDTLLIVFSWSGFQHKQHFDLLRELLKNFHNGSDVNSVTNLILDLVERLSNCTTLCTNITNGVTLVNILETLHDLTPSASIRTKIAKVSGVLLNKKWESSPAVDLDRLIKSYLSNSELKTLLEIVGTIQEEAINLKLKTDTLQICEAINKSNFYIFYRNLWQTLTDRIKIELVALTNRQHLTKWRQITLTMQGLMSIVKTHQTKSNLTSYLKKAIAILKIFLTQGIPILEIELKSETDQVIEIFKTIQTSTRFLHHLCCYSKLTKDGALMAHVPQFRLTLETLVYRVKAALVANGCEAAFWMGNLKNRDLSGEDILTQTSEDNSEEILEEEEDDEELIIDQDNTDGSEVFQ